MQPVRNEDGYVLIFATLMIVLLLILVGMGLDTGHLRDSRRWTPRLSLPLPQFQAEGGRPLQTELRSLIRGAPIPALETII